MGKNFSQEKKEKGQKKKSRMWVSNFFDPVDDFLPWTDFIDSISLPSDSQSTLKMQSDVVN